MESWLESNPDSIIEDGTLLTIGRQVETNLGSFIDLLALDKEGNTAVLELKRDRTPRDTLAQALEYASFVDTLEYEQIEQILRKYTGNENESLSEYHRAYFKLGENEGVSFNKEQRIVILGYDITPEIRQTARFLRRKGVTVTCVEFNYFQTEPGERLLSSDIVVGREPVLEKGVTSASLPRIDKIKFMESSDKAGRSVFGAILKAAEENSMPIHWGSKGFSLNVEIDGTHVALAFGYPPHSVFHESIYTSFYDINKKIKDGASLVKSFRERLEQTGLFVPAGKELKYVIQQEPKEQQVEQLTKLVLAMAQSVKEHGLIE